MTAGWKRNAEVIKSELDNYIRQFRNAVLRRDYTALTAFLLGARQVRDLGLSRARCDLDDIERQRRDNLATSSGQDICPFPYGQNLAVI